MFKMLGDTRSWDWGRREPGFETELIELQNPVPDDSGPVHSLRGSSRPKPTSYAYIGQSDVTISAADSTAPRPLGEGSIGGVLNQQTRRRGRGGSKARCGQNTPLESGLFLILPAKAQPPAILEVEGTRAQKGVCERVRSSLHS